MRKHILVIIVLLAWALTMVGGYIISINRRTQVKETCEIRCTNIFTNTVDYECANNCYQWESK